MTLSDLNADHDLQLDDRDYTTLGGFLFGQLGRLPHPGDRITVGQDVFEIVEMDARRVKTVRLLAGGARPAAPAETQP